MADAPLSHPLGAAASDEDAPTLVYDLATLQAPLLAFTWIGAITFSMSSSVVGFSVSAALVGMGWSLIMLGTTLWVSSIGSISRWLLGIHDGALLTGAVLGAFAANALA